MGERGRVEQAAHQLAKIRQKQRSTFMPQHAAPDTFVELACKYDTIEKIVHLARAGLEAEASLPEDRKVDPWAWKKREYDDFLWDAQLGAILVHAHNVVQALDARLGQCDWAIAACEKLGVDSPSMGASGKQNTEGIHFALKAGFEERMHGIVAAAARREEAVAACPRPEAAPRPRLRLTLCSVVATKRPLSSS